MAAIAFFVFACARARRSAKKKNASATEVGTCDRAAFLRWRRLKPVLLNF
jgi:hypothetical protein